MLKPNYFVQAAETHRLRTRRRRQRVAKAFAITVVLAFLAAAGCAATTALASPFPLI
ncbi:hypothetical protein GT347_15965 [Xylophilus rhododendri]|uniref:Uncharacterized protein n=1 Tax=Xylophilus rhododendri TaxID=2697032 RepID=A0A857J5T3_9BURK|nr:hypothetical protein [Xylophilus rhododendri]QHI99340.1 hypothetical protein GT347_15965 [Xylophilus rhododendri]